MNISGLHNNSNIWNFPTRNSLTSRNHCVAIVHLSCVIIGLSVIIKLYDSIMLFLNYFVCYYYDTALSLENSLMTRV